MARKHGSNQKSLKKKKQRLSSQSTKSLSRKSTKQSSWGNLHSSYKIIIEVIGALSVIGGLIYPRLTIDPASTAEKHNPFYAPFVLKNDGYLPIREIEFAYDLGQVTLQGRSHPLIKNSLIDSGADISIPYLRANKSTTIQLQVINNRDAPIESATINVHVSYKPTLFWFRFNETQQFKTYLNSQGELIWIPADGTEG
jgi:hypothetical protein